MVLASPIRVPIGAACIGTGASGLVHSFLLLPSQSMNSPATWHGFRAAINEFNPMRALPAQSINI